MRVLLVGPNDARGTITPYLVVLEKALKALVEEVGWIGSGGIPYDVAADRFLDWDSCHSIATELAQEVDDFGADVVDFHVGRLEVEQFVPPLLRTSPRLRSLHFHNVGWDLLDRVGPHPPAAARARRLEDGVDAWCFFTDAARRLVMDRSRVQRPSSVIWYPSTITTVQRLAAAKAKPLASISYPAPKTLNAAIVGTYSPWKDVEALLEVLRHVEGDVNLLIAGPFWRDAPVASGVFGRATVHVIDTFLSHSEMVWILEQSDLAVLPYVMDDARVFQGSAMLSVIGALGVPCLTFGHPATTEYCPDRALVLDPADPSSAADVIEELVRRPDLLRAHREKWVSRAPRFQPEYHAEQLARWWAGLLSEADSPPPA